MGTADVAVGNDVCELPGRACEALPGAEHGTRRWAGAPPGARLNLLAHKVNAITGNGVLLGELFLLGDSGLVGVELRLPLILRGLLLVKLGLFGIGHLVSELSTLRARAAKAANIVCIDILADSK
jgi:hypothetical protein